MRTILIVDDDEMFLGTFGRLLENEGYAVCATADGPHALAIYAARRPELVLLDLGLPSMSGIDVLKEIRKLDPDAKVIVITGYGAAGLRETVFVLGALEFLVKPVEPDVIREAIIAALKPAV